MGRIGRKGRTERKLQARYLVMCPVKKISEIGTDKLWQSGQTERTGQKGKNNPDVIE